MVNFIYFIQRCSYTTKSLKTLPLNDVDFPYPTMCNYIMWTNDTDISEIINSDIEAIKEFMDYCKLDYSKVTDYLIYDSVGYTIENTNELYFHKLLLTYDGDIIIRHIKTKINNTIFPEGYIYFIGSRIIDFEYPNYIKSLYGHFGTFRSAYKALKDINKIKPYKAHYFIVKVSLQREFTELSEDDITKLISHKFMTFTDPNDFYDIFMKTSVGEKWIYDDHMNLIMNTLYNDDILFNKDRLYDVEFIESIRNRFKFCNSLDSTCGYFSFEYLGLPLSDENKKIYGWGYY